MAGRSAFYESFSQWRPHIYEDIMAEKLEAVEMWPLQGDGHCSMHLAQCIRILGESGTPSTLNSLLDVLKSIRVEMHIAASRSRVGMPH